MTLEMPTSYQ
jgi:hypothetical protein